MKDETIGVWHDPEVEVRIVAMVLGEASDFEKAELERMIAEDSGLKQFYLEMSELHGGIHSAVQKDDDAGWKLSTERRNSVLGKLGQPTKSVVAAAVQKQSNTSHYQWRSFMSIAACLLITLFIMAVMFPLEGTKNFKSAHNLKGGIEITGGSSYIIEYTDDPFASSEGISPKTQTTPASEAEEIRDFIYPTEYEPLAEKQGLVLADEVRSLGIEVSNMPKKPAVAKPAKKQSNAVPMLGDLPVVGRLFANEKKGKSEKREGSYGFHVEDGEVIAKPELTNQIERKPSAPSSSMAKVIASSSYRATAVPVPDRAAAEPTLEFGNGDDFGDGWGDGDGSGGIRSGDSVVITDGIDILSSESTRDIGLKVADIESRNITIEGSVYAKKAMVDGQSKGLASNGLKSNRPISLSLGSFSSSFDTDAVKILSLKDAPSDGSEFKKSKSEAVRKNLYRGEGYINLGKYDEAQEEFKEVLRNDRYNKAARRGLEKIANSKSDYYRAAYDQTRAELLMEVDEAWEIAVAPTVDFDSDQKGATDAVLAKNKRLVAARQQTLSEVEDLVGAELSEATDSVANSTESRSLVQKEMARRASGVQESDAALLKGRKLYAEGNYKSAVKSYEKALNMLPAGPAVEDRRAASIGLLVDGSIALADDLKGAGMLEDAKVVLKLALEKDEKNADLNGKLQELEEQKKIPVTDEISAAEQTHSTFSLNVSDASYKLAKAALLERGEWPAAESVRTEEFINAFDYGDAKPSMAQKVACVQEQAVHPFLQQRNLLRVSMSTAAQGRSTPLNLVVLLDQSGSMERPDRAATVLRAMEELGKQLGPNDRVSLMSFARDTRLLVDGLSGDRAGELVKIMKNRPSEGGTNLEQAVQVAQQHLLARQKKGVQSRIVVLTDGAANLGDANPVSLTAMVEKMRDAGIAFDACGIGFDGLDDGILEALTRKGDGRYYVLDKPEDADASFGKKIAGALRPAAKNVKVQVVFNPDRVGKYKLLGFEKHRLKKEDFRNDAVDAAEMAAEESGSALYQIETLADGSGALGTVFVRFQDMATGEMVERSWTIPYQENATSLAASKPTIQLAAVAGLLGEKLHQSDAGTVDFSQISNVLGNLSSQYSGNKKVQELLQMVRKAQQ